jgi:hypothetical protein
MPEISRFFGIVIAMYHSEHAPPHFHARYAGQRGRFAIDDLRLLDGKLSPRARGLVIEWASRHQPELRANWERAARREPLQSIEPLE